VRPILGRGVISSDEEFGECWDAGRKCSGERVIEAWLFNKGDNGRKLDENYDELHDVDMELFGSQGNSSWRRPYDIEPKFEFVAECASSSKACVANTCELGIALDCVGDRHLPWDGEVGHVCMETLEFILYWGSQRCPGFG
jgi:hypothetical protein